MLCVGFLRCAAAQLSWCVRWLRDSRTVCFATIIVPLGVCTGRHGRKHMRAIAVAHCCETTVPSFLEGGVEHGLFDRDLPPSGIHRSRGSGRGPPALGAAADGHSGRRLLGGDGGYRHGIVAPASSAKQRTDVLCGLRNSRQRYRSPRHYWSCSGARRGRPCQWRDGRVSPSSGADGGVDHSKRCPSLSFGLHPGARYLGYTARDDSNATSRRHVGWALDQPPNGR